MDRRRAVTDDSAFVVANHPYIKQCVAAAVAAGHEP